MATVTAIEPEIRRDESESLYEVVGGKIVEKPPMGSFEVELACLLSRFMDSHAVEHGLGKVVIEMLFRIDATTRLERRPDVAFVSRERWPIERRAPKTASWNVVPDLAVEIVSPSNQTVDDLVKIEEYFRAGVRGVWLVIPSVEKIYVYDSPTAVTILRRGDALDGGALLPGFRLGLAELLGEPEE